MREGAVLGAYRLIRQIGEGGMGAVWLALHATLGRHAAVKLLHPSFSMQPEIVARFFNEARAASTIADPGIVQIFDVGHHSDGTAYIVMELLDGESLADRLSRTGRIAVGEALRVLRQVATSLGAAHARGIVHRDLKPENIFLTRDAEVAGGERAKILDFGIAKLSHDGESGVKTHTSAVMGTPTYMSPEQCRGAGTVDPRADVYSLGCVLYALLVGRPPFVAEGVGDIIAMHLREPAPRASATCGWIPAAVDALIDRCLAKAPGDRFSSGAELAIACGDLLHRISVVEATGSPVPAVPHLMPTTLSSAAASRTAPPPSGSRRGIAVGLGLGSIAAIVAVVLAWPRRSERVEVAGAAPNGNAAAPEVVVDAIVVDAAPQAISVAIDAAPVPTDMDRTRSMLADAAAAFGRWSTTHPKAPCPTASDLDDPRDAWGQPLVVTCTDQPADQQIGLVSMGPDAKRGTRDDLATWTLDLAELGGPRRRAPASIARVRPRPTPSSTTPDAPLSRPSAPVHAPIDRDGDGIPDNR